jgi:hypothetical protein
MSRPKIKLGIPRYRDLFGVPYGACSSSFEVIRCILAIEIPPRRMEKYLHQCIFKSYVIGPSRVSPSSAGHSSNVPLWVRQYAVANSP